MRYVGDFRPTPGRSAPGRPQGSPLLWTGLANIEQMVQKVEDVGYEATPLKQAVPVPQPVQEGGAVSAPATLLTQEDELSKRRQAEITRKRNLLILGIVLTLPVVILSMFFMSRFPGENYLLLALTTPVWAIVGWDFHRGAIRNLRHASANMDTLVSLGSTAAYLMSVVATFFPQVVGSITFYDTTALIVTLIFLGKYLEARATGQTNEAIRKLIGLQPRVAHVMRNGQDRDQHTGEIEADLASTRLAQRCASRCCSPSSEPPAHL
jgi:P-type Cu+ transporter